MRECKPVSIPKGAFLFCKWTMAVVLWIGLIFKLKLMIWVSFIILMLSALLKIRNAPLIWIYSNTVDKLISSPKEILDEHAMRFAHTLGAVINGICLLILYYGRPISGWIMVAILAVLKTTGAMGHCSALKLYGCMSSDNCCTFIKGKKC